jgi:hypothetical protein
MQRRDPPLKDRKLRENTSPGGASSLGRVILGDLSACLQARLLPVAGRLIVYTVATSSMMHLEYLRKHIDALVALSHDVKDRAVSARIREPADECRIMLSLADITEVVAGVNKNSEVKSPDE